MSEENNQISKSFKFTPQKFGLGARVADADKQKAAIDVTKLANRIGIVFDDSGSMHGSAIDDAHRAVDGFSKTCNPMDTSISLYAMNDRSPHALTNDFFALTAYCNTLQATGGTPMFRTLTQLLEEQSITRAIVFSDGAPDHQTIEYEKLEDGRPDWSKQKRTMSEETVVELYTSKHIPIDTVFIGAGYGEEFMKRLAEKTGGIYMHFTDPSIFAKSMKYLAPRYRAMLADPSVKSKIERGEL